MSTSPTLISWRRKSSVRKLSSANLSLHSQRSFDPMFHFLNHVIPVCWRRLNSSQPEPVKLVGSHCQKIGKFTYARKHVPAEHFNWNTPFKFLQIQFDSLRAARKIVDDQHCLALESAHISQNSMVGRVEKFD